MHREASERRNRALALEAAELVSCDPEAVPLLCDTYLYEPEIGEELLGALSVVLETIDLPAVSAEVDTPEPPPEASSTSALRSRPLRSARNILDAIASSLREEYYRDPSRDMLASFEAALTAANATIATLVEQGMLEFLTNLHGAVSAFQGTTLHVSCTGEAAVLLARHGHLTDIGEGLSDREVRHPRMAFSNIASGAVSDQDALVLASPRLLHLVPKDRLPSFLAGKHPREAIVYLRDLLAETAHTAPFALLLLRFVRAPIALPAPGAPASLPRVSGRSPRPSSLFSPSPPGSLFTRPRFAPRLPLRLRQTPLERFLAFLRRGGYVAWRLVVTRGVPVAARAARTGSAVARKAAAKTAEVTKENLARFRELRAAPEDRSTTHPYGLGATLRSLRDVHRLSEGARRAPVQLRRAFAAWPQSTKVFFTLTLIFAVLFAGSIIFLRQKRTEDAAIRGASERLQEARVKTDAAAAALIYDNTDEARRLLREAEQRTSALQQTPYYRDEVANLLAAIEAVKDKAERIVRISEPQRIGDVGPVAGSGPLQGLAAVGPHLFTFNPETNAIFQLSSETGEARTVSQTSQGIGYVRRLLALPAEVTLLLVTDSPGLALFDTARGDLVKQEINPLPEGTHEIRAAATFGSRLYLLLPERRQIFGYAKTLAGYQGGTPWLKDESVPADRAVDLGVDGYIYLLLNDGKIVKLLKGSPVEFAQSELTTPLTRPTRLLITETLKHLYVLDPPEKRVVVYDTTGALTRQFVFPSATDLRDIAIGGKEETLYLLDGTTVLKVPLKEK